MLPQGLADEGQGGAPGHGAEESEQRKLNPVHPGHPGRKGDESADDRQVAGNQDGPVPEAREPAVRLV